MYKWKSDVHSMLDRAKARMVDMGYGQVDGIDHFDTSAPTASATSSKLVAAMACKLDPDLWHMDIDQASFSRKWTPISTCALPPVVDQHLVR